MTRTMQEGWKYSGNIVEGAIRVLYNQESNPLTRLPSQAHIKLTTASRRQSRKASLPVSEPEQLPAHLPSLHPRLAGERTLLLAFLPSMPLPPLRRAS